jgi:catechol-2,3-dioxygenase
MAFKAQARRMGLSIYLGDPEGNVIELKQMPAADRKPQ